MLNKMDPLDNVVEHTLLMCDDKLILSNKVLKHTILMCDDGTLNFIEALMSRIQIHAISFYPRYNINTVMNGSRGEKEG